MRASVTTSKESRMELLRELTGLPLVLPQFRRGRGTVHTTAPADCWCCRQACLSEWHHLIPVKCGGYSFRFNFVALCVQCHRSAHDGFADRHMPLAPTPAPQKPHTRRQVEWTLAPNHPRPEPRADRPYGYPSICLRDFTTREDYERLADEYQRECEQREEIKAQCEMDIAEFNDRMQEEEFARGDFSSVEDDRERERLEERWQERQEEEENYEELPTNA